MAIFVVLYHNNININDLFKKEKFIKDADMKVFDDEQDVYADYYGDLEGKEYTLMLEMNLSRNDFELQASQNTILVRDIASVTTLRTDSKAKFFYQNGKLVSGSVQFYDENKKIFFDAKSDAEESSDEESLKDIEFSNSYAGSLLSPYGSNTTQSSKNLTELLSSSGGNFKRKRDLSEPMRTEAEALLRDLKEQFLDRVELEHNQEQSTGLSNPKDRAEARLILRDLSIIFLGSDNPLLPVLQDDNERYDVSNNNAICRNRK